METRRSVARRNRAAVEVSPAASFARSFHSRWLDSRRHRRSGSSDYSETAARRKLGGGGLGGERVAAGDPAALLGAGHRVGDSRRRRSASRRFLRGASPRVRIGRFTHRATSHRGHVTTKSQPSGGSPLTPFVTSAIVTVALLVLAVTARGTRR